MDIVGDTCHVTANEGRGYLLSVPVPPVHQLKHVINRVQVYP